MPLNKSKGNMYQFVTHTWNTVKGKCPHGCTYCYMRRWGLQKPIRFDEAELKTDLGKGNYIFVGSSCDLFADMMPFDWIERTLYYCYDYPENKYLFQSKNPRRFLCFDPTYWKVQTSLEFAFCCTLETNRTYETIMQNSPDIENRVSVLMDMSYIEDLYITIEPIMDFDIDPFVKMIQSINPKQVNIGADSGNNKLPEPTPDKITELIEHLKTFTTVVQKPNLSRLLNPKHPAEKDNITVLNGRDHSFDKNCHSFTKGDHL